MKAQAHAVRIRARVFLLAGLCTLLAWTGPAMAFFPMGEYSATGRLVYKTWSTAALHDRNHDGDISGDDEGVQVIIESGANGFTDDEIATIRDAFKVWQYIPTTFVGFDTRETSSSILVPVGGVKDDSASAINDKAGEGEGEGETGGGTTTGVELPGDLLNSIIMTDALPTGILGVTTMVFSPDDVVLTANGVSVYVTGGQIFEADIVISSAMVRASAPGAEPNADLFGVMVHEIGHFIGIDHTPLNNLEFTGEQLLENRVFAQRDAAGVLQLVGATPTMFPFAFYTDDGAGGTYDGGGDLAPDDIAAVSLLYPRGSQERFFSVQHEARTRVSQPSFPSLPIGGAHVVAWCDTDNDSNTPRVPLFSTITGLYEREAARCGFFDLKGMLKTIETFAGSSPVQATYTLTVNPLDESGLETQAVPGYTADVIASISPSAATLNVITAFPSETFYNGAKIWDMAQHDVGTPLVFDRFSNQVVSATSGKTLATMLPYHTPMFGDRNDVCPLLITVGAMGAPSTQLPGALRALRDNVLLKSGIGTALVDSYYRVAPAVARAMYGHAAVLKGASMIFSAVEFALRHAAAIAATALSALATVVMWRLRRRRALAAGLMLVIGFAVAGPASGLIAYLSDADMVGYSKDIVTGDVQSVKSHYANSEQGRTIVTEVTILIGDAVVGSKKANTTLTLQIPGGRVGGVELAVTDMPKFREGEEVLLFLEEKAKAGTLVVAGSRGKFEVVQDKASGQKCVTASTPEAKLALSQSAKKMSGGAKDDAGSAAKPGLVPVEDYKAYLRGLAADKASK